MAFHVIFTKKFSDGIYLNFDLNKKLSSWDIICPSPDVTDAVRLRSKGHDLDRQIQVITINKFLKDLYSFFFPGKNILRKVELLRYLATIWKMRFSKYDRNLFRQSFDIFTDFRSFTLDYHLIEILLENYHEVVGQAVIYFWNILSLQGLVDEHQAYENIIASIYDEKSHDLKEKRFSKGIVLLGFTHFSGNQVEFFKAISKFTDVFIPIPCEVEKDVLSTDWIDWVKTQADRVIIEKKDPEKKKLNLISFSKIQGNIKLESVWKQFGQGNIISPKLSPSLEDVFQIPSREHFFKVELDLFRAFVKKIRRDVEERFFGDLDQRREREEILDFILEKYSDLLKKERVLKSFIQLKIWASLKRELEAWGELSKENEVIGFFDILIIFEILELNLPRNYNIPLLKKSEYSLFGLKDLYQVREGEGINYVYCDFNHDLSMGESTSYSREVQKILVTLGPIRRKGLELSFYREQLREILSFENSYLLLESGLENYDSSWSYILNSFTLVKSEVSREVMVSQEGRKKREGCILEEEKIYRRERGAMKISASQMQIYMKCPRRYFYQYIMKMGSSPEPILKMDFRLIGKLEHLLIQRFLTAEDTWNDALFEQYAENILEEVSEKLKNNTLPKYIAKTEINLFAKQGILELLKLKKLDSSVKYYFEKGMDDRNSLGFADVVISSERMGHFIFDFKRSASSIPERSHVENFESIQLWYYLSYALQDIDYEDYSLIGYLSLSDPSDSLIFYNNTRKEICEELREEDFLKGARFFPLKKSISFYVEEFKNLHSKIEKDIKGDNDFPIAPRKEQDCSFCPGGKICSRKIERDTCDQ